MWLGDFINSGGGDPFAATGGQFTEQAAQSIGAYRLLDVPSFHRIGDVDNWRANPYQCCLIEAGGVSETFFSWPPPEARVAHRLDTQQVKGQDGARLVHTGLQPSRVQVRILIWTLADEQRFDRFYPKINPKLRPSGRIVGRIRHPDLNQAHISSVFIYDVSKRLGADINDAWTVSIEVLETRFTKANTGPIVSTTPNQKVEMPNQFQATTTPVRDNRAGVISPSAQVKGP